MTHQIDSILVPVNDSHPSMAAFELAKTFKAEQIELFHEVQPWAPYVDDILFPYAGLGKEKKHIESQILEQARRFFRKKFDLKKDKIDLQISKDDSTSSKLQKSSADLVIIGGSTNKQSSGRLGNYAETLIRVPVKPTLIVKGRPKISKILVAVDLSEHAAEVLNHAAQIASQVNAEMETLVVIPDGNDDVRELLQLNISINRKKLIGKCRSRIDAMFERTAQAQDLKFGTFDLLSPKLKQRKILVGEPSKVIIEYADRTDVDLIIIGSSRKSVGIGSVAHRVLGYTPTNVLVINS